MKIPSKKQLKYMNNYYKHFNPLFKKSFNPPYPEISENYKKDKYLQFPNLGSHFSDVMDCSPFSSIFIMALGVITNLYLATINLKLFTITSFFFIIVLSILIVFSFLFQNNLDSKLEYQKLSGKLYITKIMYWYSKKDKYVKNKGLKYEWLSKLIYKEDKTLDDIKLLSNIELHYPYLYQTSKKYVQNKDEIFPEIIHISKILIRYKYEKSFNLVNTLNKNFSNVDILKGSSSNEIDLLLLKIMESNNSSPKKLSKFLSISKKDINNRLGKIDLENGKILTSADYDLILVFDLLLLLNSEATRILYSQHKDILSHISKRLEYFNYRRNYGKTTKDIDNIEHLDWHLKNLVSGINDILSQEHY